MNQLHISFDHHARVATMLLRGTALIFYRQYDDYNISRYVTNSPTPLPEAGPIYQATINPQEDPDEVQTTTRI